MMDKQKDLMALQKQAKKIQDKLANTHIEADEANVTVTINGKQECLSVMIDQQEQPQIIKAFNKGLQKSQEIAAHEMKDVMANLGASGMKEMLALQKKANEIQDKLGNTYIEADEANITITINGKQECVNVKIDGKEQPNIVKAFNKALKKSQEIAAHEMKDVMGSLGLPGLDTGK
jgi:DNA-binding protein YbaB